MLSRIAGRSLWSAHAQPCIQRRWLSNDNGYFKVSEEVRQAISEKRPVIALESTIYTHGFPFPENVALASSLETIVRSANAVPATVGVLDGIAKVGLDSDELVRLASCSQQPDDLLKISRRDLAYALATRSRNGKLYCGGTTVSGTMLLAHLAGIKIFATGGLGGVHRGASETFDISADLTELGRTPVAVIASGCKAFLDIPKTLEYLETQGCSVATFADGRTGPVDFPGFWSRDSGSPSPITVDNESNAARMIHAHHAMGLSSGILFGNPIPAAQQIPLSELRESIDQALEEATSKGATGNRATPFILARLKDLTGSRSVKANTALVQNNVSRAVQIAIELAKLEQEADKSTSSVTNVSLAGSSIVTAQVSSRSTLTQQVTPAHVAKDVNVIVAGMLAVDIACDHEPLSWATAKGQSAGLSMQTSNPARISQSIGGVGHNVALAAQLAGSEVMLCSAVGDDLNGSAALNAVAGEGLNTDSIIALPISSGKRTAQYVAVNQQSKDLAVAMADMSILTDDGDVDRGTIEKTFNEVWLPALRASRLTHMVVDGNWAPQHLKRWIAAANELSTFVIFEPVSSAKSASVLHAFADLKGTGLSTFPNTNVHLATPNEHELTSMVEAAADLGYFDRADWFACVDAFGIPSSGATVQLTFLTSRELVTQGVPQKVLRLLPFIPCITTKLGKAGVLLTQILAKDDPRLSDSAYAPYILSRNMNIAGVDVGGVYMRLFPPPDLVDDSEIISVNGVGDTFVGILTAGLAKQAKKGKPTSVEDLIDIAQRGSILTLKSKDAVSPLIKDLSKLL